MRELTYNELEQVYGGIHTVVVADGQPGTDGRPGTDGQPGTDGEPGTAAVHGDPGVIKALHHRGMRSKLGISAQFRRLRPLRYCR
jgi:bacteriocin-like protein